MKKASLLFLFTLGLLLEIPVHTASAASDYAVTERGANHRVWEKVVQIEDESGEILTEMHRYIELESGMHYLDNGQWLEADPTIELINNGNSAVALKTEQQFIFSPNINDPNGAVDLVTPDGKRLRSSPLSLSYYDPVTGQDQVLAVVRNTNAQIIAPNQILYPDAFDNVKADVLITLSKTGMEQDIILREQPPAP